jgi:hypothetical protein
MAGLYSFVTPSLRALKVLWPTQQRQANPVIHTVIVNGIIEYNIQSQVTVAAIMEWNIGVPMSGQIRQTSADRTDFAY